MVDLYILDAVVANVTNTTFTHRFGHADGPFGLHQLTSITSFPARDGVSQTVSIKTSDIVFFTIVTVPATFAIDRYCFRSRYLAHVGRFKKEKDQAAVLNEKASQHEKEAYNVEAARQSSESEPAPKSDTQAPTKRQRWALRALFTVAILFLMTIDTSSGKVEEQPKSKQETPEHTATDTQTKEEVDSPPPPSSCWRKIVNGTIVYLLARCLFLSSLPSTYSSGPSSLLTSSSARSSSLEIFIKMTTKSYRLCGDQLRSNKFSASPFGPLPELPLCRSRVDSRLRFGRPSDGPML